MALNLEICEIASQKPSNARLAANHAVAIVKEKEQTSCLMALCLLDMLAINCGYPIHLAISKKDFLNNLVYRFPPSHQYRLDETHTTILRLLRKWTVALCERSRHRADFGNVRLMYSLLKGRGFSFPPLGENEISAIVNGENGCLKTKEELQEDEKRIHEAKLDDLLHRGTPADLRAANELMKVMSGYDDCAYSAIDSTVENDLSQVEEKSKLLQDLLENTDPSQYCSDDIILNLVQECRQVLVKLERLASSELRQATLQRVLILHETIRLTLERATTNRIALEYSARSKETCCIDDLALISLNDEITSPNQSHHDSPISNGPPSLTLPDSPSPPNKVTVKEELYQVQGLWIRTNIVHTLCLEEGKKGGGEIVGPRIIGPLSAELVDMPVQVEDLTNCQLVLDNCRHCIIPSMDYK